jgi:hypothetical protein
VGPKRSVNGTRKKEDKIKLTALGFWAFANFWGLSNNQPTTIFMGPNSKFTLGEFILLWRLQISSFILGVFANYLGPLGHFF